MKGTRPLHSPTRSGSARLRSEAPAGKTSSPAKAPSSQQRPAGRSSSAGDSPDPQTAFSDFSRCRDLRSTRGPRIRRRFAKGLLGLFALLALLGVGAGLQASQVRPLNLEEMTQRAATIFSGRCVAVSNARDPDLQVEVTMATFQVSRSVKGTEHGTITIRMPASADIGTGVGALASFQKGDEVVLFLYGKSKLGMRVPVGLGQGSFRVVKDKRGQATALNDLGNRHLLRGLSAPAHERVAARFDLRRPEESMTPVDLLGMAESILAGSEEAHSGRRP